MGNCCSWCSSLFEDQPAVRGKSNTEGIVLEQSRCRAPLSYGSRNNSQARNSIGGDRQVLTGGSEAKQYGLTKAEPTRPLASERVNRIEDSYKQPTQPLASERVNRIEESSKRKDTMSSDFRHRHLYTFHKLWDFNRDGILTWEDFHLIAENYTKLQRKGKLEKDVFERWKSILEKWWDELTSNADFNKDAVVEFDEWLKFFNNLGQSTKAPKELPDFLQKYLHLLFLIMDTNKDGLFCLKDYKKYLKTHDMDVNRAEECFNFMLNDEDKENGNAMSSDRFRQLVYEFWVSHDTETKGKYILGTFDSAVMDELEQMNAKRPSISK